MLATAQPNVTNTLLERIDASPGFVGLGQSVQLISKLVDAEDGGTKDLTAAILRDAGLTAKLLLLANSSGNSRGGRNITTIDQAIAVLGLNTVKSVVLSLALVDSLSNKPQTNQLHAEVVVAYFCGTLAAEITRLYGARFSAQEAQVCGLLQNVGRMMALYHLYEIIEEAHVVQAEKNVTEEDALKEVLRVSFEDLSLAIAEHWKLSETLLKTLSPRQEKGSPRDASTALEWQQLCALFSRKVCDVLFRLPEAREKTALQTEIEYFRNALHLKDGETHEAIECALLNTDAVLTEMSFPCSLPDARLLLRKGSERVRDMLSASDALTRAKPGELSPIAIIQQVLRHIHDKYEFNCTLLCLPDNTGLKAIAGLGRNAPQITARFRCQGPKQDLFRMAASKLNDTYIPNTFSPPLLGFIPEWYRETANAKAFALLCITNGSTLLGVVYGDYLTPPSEAPSGFTAGEMVSWRNQLKSALIAGLSKH